MSVSTKCLGVQNTPSVPHIMVVKRPEQARLMLCRVSRKKPVENAPASHKTSEASCEVFPCLYQLSLSQCGLCILCDVLREIVHPVTVPAMRCRT